MGAVLAKRIRPGTRLPLARRYSDPDPT